MAHHHAVKSLAAVLLLAAAGQLAPAAEPDPKEVLKKMMARVADNDNSIQNYTCIETVQRVYFQPAASTLDRSCSTLLAQRQHPTPDMVLKLQAIDRLRLDVAHTEKGEIFSWAGANRFSDSFVDELVREGPMGTGAFSAFLSVIFVTDAKTVLYVGTVVFHGRRLMQYTFEVPQDKSHYMVRQMDGGRAPAAYSGSVLVDPDTGEPVHLSVRTDELPEATGSCQTVAELDYKRTRIGERQLLLPETAHQRFISRNGHETENSTTFASCREYSSESTVNFYQDPEPASGGAGKTPAAAPPTIPAGLRLVFELASQVDTNTAAVGDRFTGKLAEPLRDGRHVLAPKGALVEGRITTMSIQYLPSQSGLIGLSPRTVEVKGTKVRLAALPDPRTVAPTMGKNPKKGLKIFLPPRGDYSGIFHFAGAAYIFPRGTVTEWVTVFQPRSP